LIAQRGVYASLYEIQANGWLHCPALPELIFDANLDSKYGRALSLLGVDPARLSGEAGHA